MKVVSVSEALVGCGNQIACMTREENDATTTNQDAQANLDITSPALTISLDHTSSLTLTTTFVLILARANTNIPSRQKPVHIQSKGKHEYKTTCPSQSTYNFFHTDTAP